MTTNRQQLIDFLLRRKFGSLAPAPPPTLGEPRMIEASRRRAASIAGVAFAPAQLAPVEVERQRLAALETSELEKLVGDAGEEDAQRARENARQVDAFRELAWPRWAKKDLWSEAEFSAICAGLVPDERGMPADPGKNEHRTMDANRAGDDIRRGTLSGSLPFVSRDDVDSSARLYGTARHYVPSVAAEWAATRFDSFPGTLLAAVRSSPRNLPKQVGVWPWGEYETELLRSLAAAAEKFWKRYDPTDQTTAPRNEEVSAWLRAQGVSRRNAEVIATILRVDGLPTGPRT